MIMTNKILAVTPERHRGKYWQRFKSYGFAASCQFAPLTLAEIAKAVHALPLCFIPDNNRYQLAALLSPTAGDNYCVAPDGAWLGGYVPAWFRGYPFLLAYSPDRTRMMLCIDESCGLVSDTEGEPLIGADGQLSPFLAQVLEFLKKFAENKMLTQQVVDALADAGLIVPWALKVSVGGSDIAVAGVYRIDEVRLNRMDDEAFLKLRKTGALLVAYAQLFSMGHTGVFDRLAQARSERQTPVTPEACIDKLFGDDGLLRF